MLERTLLAVHVESPPEADAQAVRERLKTGFAPGAARRMTLLGMMVGSCVAKACARPAPTLVYSSEFGESISLESYLRSFPSPSPTLFQTSIHPSGFQQGCILRQQPVSEVLPLAGGPELVLQSALACLTSPAESVLWCGGDERGTWLRELGVASEASFAFAVLLGSSDAGAPIGRLRLERGEEGPGPSLHQWALILRERKDWQGTAGSGWNLSLQWS